MKWERSQMKCAVLKRKKMMMGGRKGEWWSKRFCVTLHGDDDDDWQGKRGTHAYSRDTERDRQRYRERNTDRQTVRERERKKGGKSLRIFVGTAAAAAAATANDFVAVEHDSDHLVGSMLVCGTKLACIFSLSLSCDRRARKHLPLCYIIILHESLLSKHP
jgi:hypothetical protein